MLSFFKTAEFVNAGDWWFLFALFSYLKGALYCMSFTLGVNKSILALIYSSFVACLSLSVATVCS